MSAPPERAASPVTSTRLTSSILNSPRAGASGGTALHTPSSSLRRTVTLSGEDDDLFQSSEAEEVWRNVSSTTQPAMATPRETTPGKSWDLGNCIVIYNASFTGPFVRHESGTEALPETRRSSSPFKGKGAGGTSIFARIHSRSSPAKPEVVQSGIFSFVRELRGIIGSHGVLEGRLSQQVEDLRAENGGLYPKAISDRAFEYLVAHGYTGSAVDDMYGIYLEFPSAVDFALSLCARGIPVSEGLHIFEQLEN